MYQNITPENLWFANNVYFWIVKGIGASQDDIDQLRILFKVFDTEEIKQSCVVLLNTCLVLDYKNETVKEFEISKNIFNGNYKIAVYIFVKEGANFTFCIEDIYKSSGFITAHYNDQVFEYFSSIILSYGLYYLVSKTPEDIIKSNILNRNVNKINSLTYDNQIVTTTTKDFIETNNNIFDRKKIIGYEETLPFFKKFERTKNIPPANYRYSQKTPTIQFNHANSIVNNMRDKPQKGIIVQQQNELPISQYFNN